MLLQLIFSTILTIFPIFSPALCHSPENQVFPIFQFPDEMVPVMDGLFSDWDKIPSDYIIDYTPHAEVHRDSADHDLSDLNIFKVIVGWNDRANRLYFLAEVYDDRWRFQHTNTDSLDTPNSRMTGAHVHGSDIWEIVIDADHAGDKVINFSEEPDAEFRYRSAYTQNYHLYMPPLNGHYWHWLWGKALWTKREEFSGMGWGYLEKHRTHDSSSKDDLKHLEPGHVTYECYLTPFDDLHPEGPQKSVIHDLEENTIIGLSWGFIDADDQENGYDAFWSFNKEGKIYCDGQFLADFRLMPIDERTFED
tara:strand:+ start:323 stop:1243 length:921 start_codon:yes stop_codon:yes gene_type:complete